MPETISLDLPLVESAKTYAPGTLAREIVNFDLTPEGTLRGVRGPAPYIPDYGSGYPWGGRVFGLYHTLLDHGQRDVLLVRAGARLLEQSGWGAASGSSVRVLATGLSVDPNAKYPDCFVEVGGKVIWANGIDTPRIFDGYRLLNLGYQRAPGAPSPVGPGDTGHPVFRNQADYSHPGNIGNVGNFFTAQSGALLAETYYYQVQYQDAFGNRSPLSTPGGPVTVRQEYTKDLYWVDYDNYSTDPNTHSVLGITLYPGTSLGLLSVNLDDLTRQFGVLGIPIGPAGTAKRRLFRFSGSDPVPRRVVTLDDNIVPAYPDNTPDSGLGEAAQDYIAMPTFGIACEHLGALYFVDGWNIRRSEPGFSGTVRRNAYTPLPGEPTGLFSFAGNVYAATETDLFRIEEAGEALAAKALGAGFGMVAPQGGDTTGLGVYVGLGRDGFWAMSADEKVQSISDEERPLFRRLNPAMLSRAFGRWNPDTREFVCSLPELGAIGNTLLLKWDGNGWRKGGREGVAYNCFTVTRDWRRYFLAGARLNSLDLVYALGREVGSYAAPTRTYVYRSQWLRADASGRDRFDVRAIYIGIEEAVKTATITWQTWQNGSRDVPANAAAAGDRTVESAKTATVGGVAVTDAFNTALLGTGRARTPRLTWKRIDVHIKSCESFAFDLTSSTPFRLAGVKFEITPADTTGARVSRT